MTKYCIIFQGRNSARVTSDGDLFDSVEDAIYQCSWRNEGLKDKPYKVGKIEYEQV